MKHSVTINTKLIDIINAEELDLSQLWSMLDKPDADPNVADADGNTALMYAIKNDNYAAVQLLLSSPKLQIDKINAHGNTALIYAAMVGNTDILKALINAGATIEANTRIHNTPLTIAAAKGHSDAVALLIEYGADIHAANDNHKTAVERAAQMGHREIVDILINKAPSCLDKLVIGAVKGNNMRLLSFLISKNANIHLAKQEAEKIDDRDALRLIGVYRDRIAVNALVSLKRRSEMGDDVLGHDDTKVKRHKPLILCH